MNLLGLSWQNIKAKPLNTLLSLMLFILGVGLITVLLLTNHQVAGKFDRNLKGIDLVLGAKGSPLQLILCSVFHIDDPTGNIKLEEVRPFFNKKHPLIKKAIPLGLGDSYKHFRIVGTTHDYLDVYQAEVGSGKLWQQDFEVTLGARVAKELHLKVGDTFVSAHGFGAAITQHEDHPFTVSSILKPNGSVLDQLILTSVPSVWKSHEGHSHEEEDHDHNHDHDHAHDIIDTLANATPPLPEVVKNSRGFFQKHPDFEEKELTSVLIQYKNNTDIRTLNMPRSINANTQMMAAAPAYQTSKLFEMIGVGEKALRALAFLIILVSGISIFISLFNSLKDRAYELALLRVMGSSRTKLFVLVIIEGLLMALIGVLLGILAGHIGMMVLARYMQESYQYDFSSLLFLKEEVYLIVGALVVGFVAALIPAIRASKLEISKTLAKG